MSETKIKNLPQLFERAGGTMNLAVMLGCQQISVIAWKYRGVPRQYWDELIDKFPITLETLFAIDNKIRATQKK